MMHKNGVRPEWSFWIAVISPSVLAPAVWRKLVEHSEQMGVAAHYSPFMTGLWIAVCGAAIASFTYSFMIGMALLVNRSEGRGRDVYVGRDVPIPVKLGIVVFMLTEETACLVLEVDRALYVVIGGVASLIVYGALLAVIRSKGGTGYLGSATEMKAKGGGEDS